MKTIRIMKNVFCTCICLVSIFFSSSVYAQTPLYQPIIIQPSTTAVPDLKNRVPKDLVTEEMKIPGYSGVLFETLDGKVIKESYSNYAFNPASNVKLATAYVVLKTFGPDYRFQTNVFTDGTIDPLTGILHGNIYITGRNPMFKLENGVNLALELNKLGVNEIDGDLVISSSFVMEDKRNSKTSAILLAKSFDAQKQSPAGVKNWQEFLASRENLDSENEEQNNSSAIFQPISLGVTDFNKKFPKNFIPALKISGGTFIDIVPSNARLLFSHESELMRDIIKFMLCYSNNFLAESLGDLVGGAYAVARIAQINAGINPEEMNLATSSGLGINRVTPRAQIKLLRILRNELARYKLNFGDVLPVAGVDPGTMKNRFKDWEYLSSVTAKTGNLGIDGGVSSICGEIQTKNGKMLFVIFNQKGKGVSFKNFQDEYLKMVQQQNGGPASLGYSSVNLAERLANTRIVYPNYNPRKPSE